MNETQRAIIRNVQLIGREIGIYGAGVTGEGGPLTLAMVHELSNRLKVSLPDERPAIASFDLPDLVARMAESKIGTREKGRNNEGAEIDEFESATWLDPKDLNPWCASFICWCIREALGQFAGTPPKWKRPQTPGAWDFERWAKEQKLDLKKPPSGDIKRGDIVIYTFSHIGIAVADSNSFGVECVEGNTNENGSRDGNVVAKKTRAHNVIRSRIRLA